MDSISEKAHKRFPTLILFFAFGMCLLMGLLFTHIFLVRPVLGVLGAKEWEETPCLILSSRVRSHSDGDGTTYSIDITYEYTVKGVRHQSGRYDFMGGSSSGYEGKKEVVDRYPPGSKAVCYVDPKNPSEAVLERGFTPVMLLGLVPLVFVLVGGGGLYWVARRALRPGEPPAARAAVGAAADLRTGPVTLKPALRPAAKLAAAVLVCVFWNGIVAVFLGSVIDSWVKGRPEWFPTIFLIPFALVGLGLAGWVIYQFLALFNPRPRLVVGAAAVPLGGSVDLEWEMEGNYRRLESLKITFEGREEATYRRGTSSQTDRETFAAIVLADLHRQVDMKRGRARIDVPADAMHTFAAPHNKIVWAIHVRGGIARWPDVKEEFPVVVLPFSPEKGA